MTRRWIGVVRTRRGVCCRKRRDNKQHPPRAATSVADYWYLDDPDKRYRESDRPTRQLSSRDREFVGESWSFEASSTRRERERDSMPMDRAGSSLSRYNYSSHAHTPSPVPLLATPHHMQERISTANPASNYRWWFIKSNRIYQIDVEEFDDVRNSAEQATPWENR